MKVTEVTYEMKRVTKQYENDTATVTIALEAGDKPEEALEAARKMCDDSLAAGREASMRDKLKKQMETPEGRASLERFLNNCCR